jgi:hypothetical protein
LDNSPLEKSPLDEKPLDEKKIAENAVLLRCYGQAINRNSAGMDGIRD